jgi:hypothetical protein
MEPLSEIIRTVENRLVRLVNEAIKYKFGINGEDRRIRLADLVIDPSTGVQNYYFRDEAVYNKGPWKDFVDYSISGRLPPNTTVQKLFLDVDKAIIDGDIIVKLIDTPGQAIDWDDLRGWHYHSPGGNFNDDFDHSIPRESDDRKFRMGGMTMETMEKMMKMMMVIMRKVLRKMIAMMKTMSHQFRANSLESTAARLLNAIAVLTN